MSFEIFLLYCIIASVSINGLLDSVALRRIEKKIDKLMREKRIGHNPVESEPLRRG